MKTLGVMQPYWLPYIGYFQLMNAVDEYIIYDDVQFIKGGWINRNNMLMGKNKTLFTMSLNGASPNKKINEIEIADDFEKFLKSLEMAYSKAPEREPTMQLIRSICGYPDRNLAKFLGNSLQQIGKYLGMDTKLTYSSSLDKDNSLPAQDRLISMCKLLAADRYLNAIGGQELYDKAKFQDQGIQLQFVKSIAREYKQFSKEFVPNLSIIDVMMFNTPDQIRELLSDYELV